MPYINYRRCLSCKRRPARLGGTRCALCDALERHTVEAVRHTQQKIAEAVAALALEKPRG